MIKIFQDEGCDITLHAHDDGTPVAVTVVATDGSGDGYAVVTRQPGGGVAAVTCGPFGDDATSRLCAFMAARLWKDRPIPLLRVPRSGPGRLRDGETIAQ